ncbi:MAG: metal-dependent transcriptional regulator [Planctomycetaceae bacterium]|nr:metal-dependent transcriptional regulator [Planctomycetaceae bacterium]
MSAKNKSAADHELSSSQEDYLEAVCLLVQRDKVARVRDIAEHMKVGMPSVTAALKNLSGRGLVNYDPYEVVTLTPTGEQVAQKITRTHTFLRRFLIGVLGISPDSAEANACRLEHAVDGELLERLRSFAEFIEHCPRTGPDWVQEFLEFCNRRQDPEHCKNCRADRSSE